MIWGSAGFILGIVLGSFIKALADRSLKRESFWGRSYCVQCKKILRWYDLFPVLSFISTQGTCRYCHKKISLEYPLVEIVVGILIGFLFFQQFSIFNFQFSNNFQILNFKFLIFLSELLTKIFFICVLAALFITDLKKMFIPDRIIFPAIRVSIIFITVITIIKIIYLYFYLNQSPVGKLLLPPHSDYFLRHAMYTAQPLLGGILMGLLIGGFFWGLIIITKGKGMGGGDVKLGAFMGLMLGFPQALIALVLSFLTGAIFSIILIIFGKKHFGQVIPFGPFLVLGSLIALFWGQEILNWYLSFKF